MADDLVPLLQAYTSGALTHLASFHGLAKKGPRPKDETVRLLAEALANPNRLRTVSRELTPPERAVIEALQRGGGRLSVRSLRETLKQQWRTMTPDQRKAWMREHVPDRWRRPNR